VLQPALNPGDGGPEVQRFGWTFRIGDRVIQTENDYDKDVFNGNLGIIEKTNPNVCWILEADGRARKLDQGQLLGENGAAMAIQEQIQGAQRMNREGCRKNSRSLVLGPSVLLAAAIALALGGASRAGEAGHSGGLLPEGRSGIAAKYPGDKGIEADPRLIFVEKFDQGSLEAVLKRWDSAQGKEGMSLASDVPKGSADRQSLLLVHTGGRGTGGQLYRRLLPGYRQVFARFYVKFDPDCAPIHHFGTHLGGFRPPTPWPQGGAGTRPRGDDRFTTGVEPCGDRWQWDFYTYWQGMHVHGDGRYWGTPFLSGVTHPKVERGKWICVEMMVKLNDPPGDSNGEQAFWIDGKLWRVDGQVVSHVGKGFPRGEWAGGWWHPDANSKQSFEGFQWRSVKDLAVNYVWAYLYITKAPQGHVSKVWFDNIVVAQQYVGPIEPPRGPVGR